MVSEARYGRKTPSSEKLLGLRASRLHQPLLDRKELDTGNEEGGYGQ